MADFEIERPSVEVQSVNPVYNVNTPTFTIEINGGATGQKGDKGDKGDTGEPGSPNVLSIGTVVDGNTASASITGTSPNQVLNLVLPQGADGTGIASVEQTTTSTADDGENIVTITLTDGTTEQVTIQNGSKGTNGEKGDTGDSGVYIGDTEPVDENKNVWIDTDDGSSITIPTKTSDLTNDSGYITSSYHDNTKQDVLVSGTNIKTINNTSLLGSGDITISSGGTATDVQINGTSITSSDVANILTNTAYNSSTNKIATMSDLPSIPTNVSSFNNDSGYITNSVNNLTYYTLTSSLSSVATSGSYNDLANKPTIPTSTSDLTNDSGYITSSSIPTKLSDFTDDLGSSPTHTHSQYLTSHQDLSSYATISYVDGLVGDIETLLGGI